MQEFYLEAKHGWGNPEGDPRPEAQKAKEVLDDAIRDVEGMESEDRGRENLLALAFLSPCVTTKAQIDRRIDPKLWLTGIMLIPHDAIAWYFPGRETELSGATYPYAALGSVLLIKRL